MQSLTLLVPEPLVEQASDALMFELGALSVTVEDADAGSPDEQALFGEPGMPIEAHAWHRSRVVCLFDDALLARKACDDLLAEPWARDIAVHGLADVPDADWVRLTQSQFDPVSITPTFWVVPSWHQAPSAATQVLRLDPGLAFGSGTHPTTRMCLAWIATRMPKRATVGGALSVLDYGCGSGILAIGAAMFGAQDVCAVDIDPAAVTATRDNAEVNRVRLTAGLPDVADGAYDVVLANILATPLKLLAPVLAARMKPTGSHLVLAGILERQVESLQAAYAPWCHLDVADACEGWVLLVGSLPRP